MTAQTGPLWLMREESDDKRALKTRGGTNARVSAMTLPL